MLGKTPAGKGFYDANGQWIRTQHLKKENPDKDNFGLSFLQPSAAPVQTEAKYTCDICDVNVTSQSQLDMHIAGQKHKKKVNSINLNASASADGSATEGCK